MKVSCKAQSLALREKKMDTERKLCKIQYVRLKLIL